MDEILNSLLDKKLVTGGQIIEAPARFLWKGKIENINYISVTTWTVQKNKDEVIADVKRTSKEDFPMLSFILFEGNKEFTQWIGETVK